MATIFDADNKIFALEIIDDKVTLNGSTIVYYFGDTPPTGDFSSKTLTKFDPINHSIDIGSGNELSMPTKIMKDFLVDKSVTVSGVTIAPTFSFVAVTSLLHFGSINRKPSIQSFRS